MKIKHHILYILFLIPLSNLFAQGIKNNGANIVVKSGANVVIDGVSGGFSNTAGSTLKLDGTINLDGNWSNFGLLEYLTGGTVNLTGTDQTLFGSSNFYTLKKTSTTIGALTFEAGQTQTISNSLVLQGATGNILSLRSSIVGTQWKIDPTGTINTRYLSVQDGNNLNGVVINPANSLDQGNNEFWFTAGNTDPKITSSATVNVPENQTDIITVSVSDDAGDTHTFSLTGGDDVAKFSIDASSGVLTFVTAPDYEAPTDIDANNEYLVEVTVKDAAGASGIMLFHVFVTDAGEFADHTPVITSPAQVSVEENQTEVTAIVASDSDVGDVLTYEITGGADAKLFSITTAGVLEFLTAPDFENPSDTDTDNEYLLDILVKDKADQEAIQTLRVTVTNVNEAPSITSASSFSVPENKKEVGDIQATDSDKGDKLTYSISSGTDHSLFEIDETTGTLSFIDAPDFENPNDGDTNNEYLLEVKVTDNDGQAITASITVTVTDIDDSDPDKIEASNFISPNGDSKNDTWIVKNVEAYQEFDLYIYNNIGEVVFETKGYDNSWDGTYNSVELPDGSYFYVFKKDDTVLKGAITIVR